MKLIATTLLAVLIAQNPWQQAVESAEAGDLAAAEGSYRSIIEQDPMNPEAHYDLGTVLIGQRRFDDAKQHLEIAARAGVPAGAAPYNLGNADLEPAFADSLLVNRDERLRGSIESYKAALRADPTDDDARWNLELARRLLERETPPENGGGGGGGGGDGPPQQGQQQPNPTAGGGSGPQPRMTEAEAEELLQSAQERELEVQRDRLKKPQPPGPIMP